jgi:phage shock protein PspC (stress-responsive transcriptional regulator)
MNSGSGTKVLVRKRNGRMLAGVCAGLADYLGQDVTLIRVIVAAIAVVTGGAGILAYLVAWAIIPEESQENPVAENLSTRPREGSPR